MTDNGVTSKKREEGLWLVSQKEQSTYKELDALQSNK